MKKAGRGSSSSSKATLKKKPSRSVVEADSDSESVPEAVVGEDLKVDGCADKVEEDLLGLKVLAWMTKQSRNGCAWRRLSVSYDKKNVTA